jgi:hypothetical protein
MSDNITISTFQLFKLFPDEETARKGGLEKSQVVKRWAESVCGEDLSGYDVR